MNNFFGVPVNLGNLHPRESPKTMENVYSAFVQLNWSLKLELSFLEYNLLGNPM